MKLEIKYKEEFDNVQDEERFLRNIANRYNYRSALWDFSQLWVTFKYDEDTLTLDSLKEAITAVFEDNNINLNDLD
jgi:uncharacterized protein YutD